MNPIDSTNFQAILKFYEDLIFSTTDETTSYILPIIPLPILTQLCRYVATIFLSESCILQISTKCIIVGDIHGHLCDIFRLFRTYGLPPGATYLFLGDLVDRGDFSTEVVSLIFILKILFPSHIYVIRGNHEFSFICQENGFSKEIFNIYQTTEAEQSVFLAFNCLPLAARIGKDVICVHGGIGPFFGTLSQIAHIQRPLDHFKNPIVASLLWSDPSDNEADYTPSARGEGYYFGSAPLSSFLTANEAKLMVRGHECVENGVQEALMNKIITVFSASNYCGLSENRSGCLIMEADGTYLIQSFPLIPYLHRNEVSFIHSISEKMFQPQSLGATARTKKLKTKRVTIQSLPSSQREHLNIAPITMKSSNVPKVVSLGHFPVGFQASPLSKKPSILKPNKTQKNQSKSMQSNLVSSILK